MGPNKPWVGSLTDPTEGGVLVFAPNQKEAKKLAFPVLRSWFWDAEWIDMRVRTLTPTDWIMEQAVSDDPHVVESPKSCESCFQWGVDPIDADGMCAYCADD